MRDDIGQNAPARDTNEECSEQEVPFIDEVLTLPVVANAAVPAAVPDAPIQSLAAAPAAIPVVNADHASTVTASPTVESVVPQRGGAQRYDLRPRLKPSTRDAFLIIVALIMLLSLAACFLPMSPLVGVARNSKNHSKLLGVDGKSSYVGSFSSSANFSADYANSINYTKRTKTSAQMQPRVTGNAF